MSKYFQINQPSMIKTLFAGVCVCAVMAGASSCVSTRSLQYMQGSFDTAKLSTYNLPQLIIQKGDLLSIVVYSDNPAASAIYNQAGAAVVSGVSAASSAVMPNAAMPTQGYLVNETGDIQFQSLGTLHVEGLTKTQLTDTLNRRLAVYLTNPYCNVRFLNYKITVIGDVARPASYNIPAERVNILEALGLAGDLNVTARRDNVLVVREQNGKREWGRIDLTKPDIFTSPFYQLQQNDVVYVDLSKSKAVAADQTTLRNISIATSIVSTIAIVITVFRR
jgi:polysaccharide export outer membrane protein